MTIQTNDRICSVGAIGHMGGAQYAVTAAHCFQRATFLGILIGGKESGAVVIGSADFLRETTPTPSDRITSAGTSSYHGDQVLDHGCRSVARNGSGNASMSAPAALFRSHAASRAPSSVRSASAFASTSGSDVRPTRTSAWVKSIRPGRTPSSS
jgi:hypothetical protein